MDRSVIRICLDLNVWCAAWLADRAGRRDTASQMLVEATRSGHSGQALLQLVVSWGMLERLRHVLVDQLLFERRDAGALTDAIAGYAHIGPSLTLGGVGVIPIHDLEDRHVLETAWAGRSDVLVTANLRDFVQDEDKVVLEDRIWRLTRGDADLIVMHPFEAARSLRDGTLRMTVDSAGA